MSPRHGDFGRRARGRTKIDLLCAGEGVDGCVPAEASGSPAAVVGIVVVPLAKWEAPDADLLQIDARVTQAAERGPFVVRFTREPHDSGRLARAWRQAALRYQRFRARRNDASEARRFSELLRRHRALHDLRKPLVAADYAHARDVWQWVLRLAPAASFELQAAALLHDIERLVSEPDTRVEQHAADYAAFKEGHAHAGARMAADLLRSIGTDDASVARVQALIAGHEHAHELASSDPLGEKQLLADADVLSFFSLNAFGFVRYYGAAHTARKVEHSLARLSVRARRHLAPLKLPPIVATELKRSSLMFASAPSDDRARSAGSAGVSPGNPGSNPGATAAEVSP